MYHKKGNQKVNDKLKLNDILQLTKEELSRTKIRLNTYNGDKNPIDEFKKNPQLLLDWNYWNNKPYKEGQISIGLVNMGNHKWLLFTVGVIKKVLSTPIKSNDGINGIQVEYETLEKYNDLYGRVVVHYHNKTQQLFRNADLLNDLEIKEILPSVFTGFDFPGYDNVCLSFEELESIVNGNYGSYHNALRNQKAVYLQTDKATGKLYVGSATSKNDMLLARWGTYIRNGHGGNKDLIDLINEKGFDYVKKNFQYSILENFNSRVDDNYVLARESFWKEVLQSRKFGYNKN
ncbi:MAG: GIY-YIG nuclease family protein [Clostridiales bacterium]|nr:GIY-YIG nuclease family protein [Clostridiales bacterium]